MSVREADHAGSWYTDNGQHLAQQLDHWLDQVPDDLGAGKLPLPGSRAVLAPHAGYAYSGPAAAWAYKSLDLSKAKRIFILHPSHHHPLSSAALPIVQGYATPLSSDPLPLDLETIKQLASLKGTTSQGREVNFTTMSKSIDEAEHSCEMQLPYIHRLLQKLYPKQPTSSYPPLVPIMIGSTSASTEAALGKLLAPYVADESNAFAISSDFCHWGSRFGYTYYVPNSPSPAFDPRVLPNGVPSNTTSTNLHESMSDGTSLRRSPAGGPKIFESIAHVDRACMCAIGTGSHQEFLKILQSTGNTICGRHPIGVFMAAVEEVKKSGRDVDGIFHFMRYERSSDCTSVRDSSVSYVSAYAQI